MPANCDFCLKKLDRKVFCTDSHRVQYARTGKPSRLITHSVTSKQKKPLEHAKPIGTKSRTITKHGMIYCPHGMNQAFCATCNP